jgi:hypothetical protein
VKVKLFIVAITRTAQTLPRKGRVIGVKTHPAPRLAVRRVVDAAASGNVQTGAATRRAVVVHFALKFGILIQRRKPGSVAVTRSGRGLRHFFLRLSNLQPGEHALQPRLLLHPYLSSMKWTAEPNSDRPPDMCCNCVKISCPYMAADNGK